MVTSVPIYNYYNYNALKRNRSGATTSGGIRVQHYYPVGPAEQLPGLGWGLGQWSGTVSGEAVTSLTSGINSSQTTGGLL